MPLAGIPISKSQCIGDSLQTINAAFSSLDLRTLSLISGAVSATNILGDVINLGDGTSTITVSGDLITTGNATISGDLIVGEDTFLGKDCSKKTTIKGTLSLPCTGQNAIEFNGETSSSGNPVVDGAVIQYQPDLFGVGLDGLLFEKTDVDTVPVDGGIAFRNRITGGGTDQAFSIKGNGRVGVGTFYPNKEFTVIGDISATNDVYAQNFYGNFVSSGINLATFNVTSSPTIIPSWDPVTRTFSASAAFMPLQQGGGTGQGNEKIHIGWNSSSSRLYLQANGSDYFANWPISCLSANTANFASVAAICTSPNTSFMPVQQGGVTGQGNEKIHIGWNAANSHLYLHANGTDYTDDWPINCLNALSADLAINAILATTALSALSANQSVKALSSDFADFANVAASCTSVNNIAPTGLISYTINNTPPAGWYICDGSPVPSSPANDDLRAFLTGLGNPFGNIGGNPQLPDLRGIFIRGAGMNASGITGVNGLSATLWQYQADAFESHSHPLIPGPNNNGSFALQNVQNGCTSSTGCATHVASWYGTFDYYAGSTGGTETRPANLSLTPIIKL